MRQGRRKKKKKKGNTMNTKLATRNNGIAKAEKPFAPGLSPKECSIVKASRSAHCHRLLKQGDPEVNHILTKALRSMQAVTGYAKPDTAEENFNAEVIAAMIDVVERHTWLKVQELELIIQQGMIGEYGDFYGLNARVLNGWIKAHFEGQRTAAIKKQAAFDQAQQEEAEKAHQKALQRQAVQSIRESLISAYSGLKKHYTGKQITYQQIPPEIDTGNIWYEKFWKAGIHRVGKATFEQYTEEEVPNARTELTELKTYFQIEKGAFTKRAKSLARSRVFREKLAELLNAGADIEKVLKEHNL